jgi:hypothetical protein
MTTPSMENWRDIPGYEGRYQVSDAGRVCGQKGLLSLQPQNNGYLVAHLYLRGARRICTVHRLVALAFVAGHFDGAHVNHLDCDRRNNAASNLEWTTQKQNMEHAVAAGRMNARKFAVVGVPLEGDLAVRFPSQRAAEKALSGRDSSAIYHCLVGKKKSAYGHTWSRA